MSNDDIAQVLQETADLLELTGGNPHRARAFSRAARSLSGLTDAVADRHEEGTLVDVQGIGDAMAEHVADILHGGSFALRDELLSAVPPGLMDVMQVKGLGTRWPSTWPTFSTAAPLRCATSCSVRFPPV